MGEMQRATSIILSAPPPLWASVRINLSCLMRDLGAPGILLEGRLIDTPFGPRIVATLDVPSAMGDVGLCRHPAYRRAMRDAAGLMTYVRMVAMGAGGIGPVTASREPEEVVWTVIALPAGMVLTASTEAADFGPFLLWTERPSERQVAMVERQLAFFRTAGGETENAPPLGGQM